MNISYNIGNKYNKNVEKIRKRMRIKRAFSPKADGKLTGIFLINKMWNAPGINGIINNHTAIVLIKLVHL